MSRVQQRATKAPGHRNGGRRCNVARTLCAKLLKAGWPDGVVLNFNFPDCEPEAVKGFVATMQGQRDPDLLRIEDRHVLVAGPSTGLASSGGAPNHQRGLTCGRFGRI